MTVTLWKSYSCHNSFLFVSVFNRNIGVRAHWLETRRSSRRLLNSCLSVDEPADPKKLCLSSRADRTVASQNERSTLIDG